MSQLSHRLLANRWAGIFLLALGVVGLAAAEVLASRPSGPNPGGLWWVALSCGAVGAAALVLPWQRWPSEASLGLAVAALGLLVAVDAVSGLSKTSNAAAAYPAFVIVLLAWVGATQPRHTALAFSLCAGAAVAAISLASHSSALPLRSLVIVLPCGAALGEGASWLHAELARASRRDAERAGVLAELARTLEQLPERTDLTDAAELIATMACRVFGAPAAQALLAGRDGGQVSRTAGDVALLADFDGRARLRHLVHATSSGEVRTAGDDGHDGPGGAYAGPDGWAQATPWAGAWEIVLRGATRTVGTVALAGDWPSTASAPRTGAGPATEDTYRAQLARIFASQVGNAVEHFERIKALDHAVHHDDLTGTGNRRHASMLLARLRPGDGVVLVDIDHFKEVNDRSGHRAGDDLLTALGTFLSTYVRGSDDVARFGGDEFLVVVRGGGAPVATTAARLVEGWRAMAPVATISLGAAVHRAGDSPEATLDRADAALYDAKRAGRDCVVAAPE